MIPLFDHIEGLIRSKTSYFKTLFSIFKLEAKLAGLSIVPLMLSLVLLMLVGLTLWFAVMLLLGYVAFLFFHTFIYAVCSILILNLLIVCILVKCLIYYLRSISFERTRACLSLKERNHEEFQTPDTLKDNPVGTATHPTADRIDTP